MENDFAPDAIDGGIPRRKGYKLITDLWESLGSMSPSSGAIRSLAADDQNKEKCQNCGAELVGTKFCIQCGERITKSDEPIYSGTTDVDYYEKDETQPPESESSSIPQYCTKCGASTEGRKFCMSCGEKLVKEDTKAYKPTSDPEIPKAIPIIKYTGSEDYEDMQIQEDTGDDNCPNCGSKTESKKFCMNCGEKLDKSDIPTTIQATPVEHEPEPESLEVKPVDKEIPKKEEERESKIPDVCPSCGWKTEGKKFCMNCGKKLLKPGIVMVSEELPDDEEIEVSEIEDSSSEVSKHETDQDDITSDIDWEKEKKEKSRKGKDKSKKKSDKKKLFCPYCGTKTDGKKSCPECKGKL